MVEVLVLEPALIGANHQNSEQSCLSQEPAHGLGRLLIPLRLVGDSENDIEQGEQIVGDIVLMVLFLNHIEG